MTYVKNTWVDQEGQVRYRETQDGDLKILTPNYEQVTEIGTPVNADNMNHIEQGIADSFDYTDTEVANAKDYSLNLLKTIYPVGSIYIGTTEQCPLSTLFGTWEKVSGGRVLQGADNNHAAGTTIAAGLPNITGSVSTSASDDFMTKYTGESSGAFNRITGWCDHQATNSGGSDCIKGFNFNAFRSSSIYGQSNTVQPPAYVVNIWRRTA